MGKKKLIVKRNREDYVNTKDIIQEIKKERFGSSEFMDSIDSLYDPFKLNNCKEAIDIIINSIRNNEDITVYGDYDTDGCTSVYTSICCLKNVINILKSRTQIHYCIPHRVKEGYGLNKTAIGKISKTGTKLIITVDNGISGYDEIEYVKELGMKVIVTDHHDFPDVLPKTTIVSCKDGKYPFPKLCGCGVIFKVMLALYDKLGLDKEYVMDYIDIVAIATIADVVELNGENRVIVKEGLYRLNKNIYRKDRFWIKCLLDEAKIKPPITSSMISFVIAPRINAIGRLYHAYSVINYLLERIEDNIAGMAVKINNINEQRKTLQEDAVKEAHKNLEASGINNSIVMALDCPEGVVGLVASNLLEEYYRPVTIFSKNDKGEYKGSGRSIPGIHYFNDVIKKNKDIIIRGGGHELAGGLTIAKENIPLLNKRINNLIDERIRTNPELLQNTIKIESELYPEDISIELYDEICTLEPYGEGNKEPMFLLNDMTLVKIDQVPKNAPKHLQLKFKGNNVMLKSIFFKSMDKVDDFIINKKYNIVFTLEENYYNNARYVNLRIVDYECL